MMHWIKNGPDVEKPCGDCLIRTKHGFTDIAQWSHDPDCLIWSNAQNVFGDDDVTHFAVITEPEDSPMKTATELARELAAGPELDALFFETCYHWKAYTTRGHEGVVWAWQDENGDFAACPNGAVSTDAAACEAWAMRWAREKKCLFSIVQRICDDGKTEFVVQLRQWYYEGWYVIAEAIAVDWWHALVRACIAAAEQLNPKGPDRGN